MFHFNTLTKRQRIAAVFTSILLILAGFFIIDYAWVAPVNFGVLERYQESRDKHILRLAYNGIVFIGGVLIVQRLRQRDS